MPSIVCCRCQLGPAFPFEALRNAPGGESVYCIPCLKAIAPFDPILDDDGEPNIFPGCCGMCCEAVPPNYASRPFEESGLLRICSECTNLLRNPDSPEVSLVVGQTQSRDELLERRDHLRDFIAFTAGQRQRMAAEIAEAEREEDEACAELRQIEAALAAGDAVECTAE